MAEAPLLDVRALSIDLAAGPLLQDAEFAIRPGEIVGLCGASGCGKTSLALALLKLLPRQAYRVRGSLRLDGRELMALTEKEMERVRGAAISMVFQDPLQALNPVMRVGDQVREAVRAHRRPTHLERLFEMVDLPGSARIPRAYPHQLSGGERQRICLALALAAGPALVLADEPFTALDPPRVVELARLFRRLRDGLGTSFLLISHSQPVLRKIADRILAIRKRRLDAI
jgi:ABC-type glutathione transport system ATPase component